MRNDEIFIKLKVKSLLVIIALNVIALICFLSCLSGGSHLQE